jgi:hypothetical protein
MAATPIKTQTTTISYNSQTIDGVMSMTGIGSGSATEIPTTTLASTAKEFVQGLQDFGSFSIDVTRNQDDAGQAAISAALAAQSTNTVVITLPTSTLNVLTFSAFVTQFTTDINADGIVTGKATFRIVSAPVYS